ncbi:MAG TPA: protein kinase, partial [Pyrinomonadaceae bacterium]|nr:protein kinase [Pyrinomonadaceae bacterium]
MNPSDYKKVKDIFNAVLEIEPEGRAAFLDDRCDGENGLRDEVERLLASCDSEFLETPVIGPFAEDISLRSSHSGQLIGHYSVITKIGAGGMGDVYLAEDTKLGRRVAIKILPKEFTTDADRLSRFHLEARSASSLTHPNILTIHEIGEWESTHYIATEYVEGETLRHRLSRGRLTIDESMEYGVQLVSAVVAAHEAGVTHRDIKPENIMIRRDGLVKILDFGLAKFSGSFVADALPVSSDGPTVRIVNTEPGIIMGTVQYMSPEQARGQITDGRTDIWSLGCVLYEMLAGSPPFSGANSADLIAELVKTHPKSLSEYDPEIPERLDEIVAKSLEKNPDERYQTAKDLLIDLKRLRRRYGFEGGVERLDPAVTTDPGNGAVTGPNLINTKSGPKDLTTVRGTEYFIWGIKAHRVLAVGIGLLIAALLGGTVYVVRNYWKGPNELRIEYANKIKLAAQALEASNFPSTKQFLDEARPSPGEDDLRGFEWGYLSRLLAERTASQPLLLTHESLVNEVAFSRDGETLVTAGGDNKAHLWDVSTGQQIAEFVGHSKPIVSVALSPNGKKLATGSVDGTAKLWDVATRRLLLPIESLDQTITLNRLIFSPDGNTLYGEVADRALKGWDISTGAEVSDRITSLGLRHPFAWSPDGKYIAGQRPDRSVIEVREVASGLKVATLDGNFGFVTDVKFAPDSKSILTAGTDGIARLWSLPKGTEVWKFTDLTGAMAFSPNSKTVATGNKQTIKLWDVEKRFEIATLYGPTRNVGSIAFSPDGRKLASSGGWENVARVWNVPTRETRGILRGHSAAIIGLSFSHDNKLIASASQDKTAKIWDVQTETDIRTLVGHTDHVNSTSFSKDARILATASQDGKVRLWDVVSGRKRQEFDTRKSGAGAILTPDGTKIATGYFMGAPGVQIWDAGTGKGICSFGIGDRGTFWAEFSKDGLQITASFGDNTVRRWDTLTCNEIWRFNGNAASEYASIFRSDGKLVALEFFNNNRSVKLIEPETGKEGSSIGGDSEFGSIRLSPEGSRLATSEDGTLKLWDAA